MKTRLLASAAGLLLALTLVVAGTPGAWEHYRFKTGRFDVAGESGDVIATLRVFSGTMAGFYMTAGREREGLNSIPASNSIKRRIFMDINMYTNAHVIFVPDRDETTYREVTFLSPLHAVAVAEENWFNIYQDSGTRRPVSGKRFAPVTVRYYLKKQGGKWIILDYEVHSREPVLPPVPRERILQW